MTGLSNIRYHLSAAAAAAFIAILASSASTEGGEPRTIPDLKAFGWPAADEGGVKTPERTATASVAETPHATPASATLEAADEAALERLTRFVAGHSEALVDTVAYGPSVTVIVPADVARVHEPMVGVQNTLGAPMAFARSNRFRATGSSHASPVAPAPRNFPALAMTEADAVSNGATDDLPVLLAEIVAITAPEPDRDLTTVPGEETTPKVTKTGGSPVATTIPVVKPTEPPVSTDAAPAAVSGNTTPSVGTAEASVPTAATPVVEKAQVGVLTSVSPEAGKTEVGLATTVVPTRSLAADEEFRPSLITALTVPPSSEFATGTVSLDVSPMATPEPSTVTLVLFGGGLVGLARFARRKTAG